MKDRVPEGVFDVSRHLVAGKSDSAKDTNDRASDGGHDQKEHHHGHRPVLIFVIQSGAKDAVSRDRLSKTSGFLELRSLSSWDTFTITHFATHDPTNSMKVIALAKEEVPQPSFTDAIIFLPWSGTISVWQVSGFTLRLRAAQVEPPSVS
ncbi:MAG: hypothetical protein VXA43_04075, partial [Candidatus Poseidoniales archaeon]